MTPKVSMPSAGTAAATMPTVTFDASDGGPSKIKVNPASNKHSVTSTTLNRTGSVEHSAGPMSKRSGKSSASRSRTTSPKRKTKDLTARRVIMGRLLFCSFLCVLSAVLGSMAYYILRSSERKLANKQFESIADRALDTAEQNVLRRRLGSFTMSSIVANAFPNSSTWPYVYLDGYEEITTNIVRTSNGRTMGMAPIIFDPDGLAELEEYAYARFAGRFPGNDKVGVSSFGRGTWGTDRSLGTLDNRYHDTSGNTTYGSPNRIFTPVIQHSLGVHPALMFNLHSQETRGRIIDGIIACSKERAIDEHGNASHDCGVISNMLTLVGTSDSSPGALIMDPIYADDSTKLVGLTLTSVHWREAFLDIFTKEVSGVDCVLETDAKSFTYHVSRGVPVAKGEGDLHERSHREHRKSIRLTRDGLFGPDSADYTLHIYPSEEFFATYDTGNPVVATIGAVCIIIFTSFLFLLYDFFVRQEVSAKKELLEAKRKFVRFVSHEVRTPLNSVCMGLTLMQEEMAASIEKAEDDLEELTPFVKRPLASGSSSNDNPVRGVTKESMDRVNEWLVLAKEVYANAQSSVDVLNDLLNYDKIEMGNLTLELTVVPIWKLIETTAMEFKLPATKKNIRFSIHLGSDGDNNRDLEASGDGSGYVNRSEDLRGDIVDRMVVGDAVRLTQVLRNLLSNAIKFSPDSGSIEVKASWVKAAPAKDPEKFSLSNGEEVAYSESGRLEVSVTDSGAGMSSDQVANLFKNGVQFNVNELQAGQGSGLGLFIAKGIMAQHGGTLTADSKGIGKGTTFTMTIPLFHIPKVEKKEEEQYATANAGQASPPLGQQLQQPKQGDSNSAMSQTEGAVPASPSLPAPMDVSTEPVYLNFLVVDDAGTNRKLLRRLLERHGHTCDDAEDGQVAVDKVKAKMSKGTMYDAILLDFEMPVMNGPTAAKVMREMGCDAFIVGITGNVLYEDVSYFKSCGANGVLSKPFKMAGLDELWAEYGMSGSVLTISNKRNKRIPNPAGSALAASTPVVLPTATPIDISEMAIPDPKRDASPTVSEPASLFSLLES